MSAPTDRARRKNSASPNVFEQPLSKREMVECLRRSGYLMEGRLAQALQAKGCFVESNLSFPDPRTGISREIDMVVEIDDFELKTPQTCVKTTFIIEAINNLYPVVLLTPKGFSPNTDPSDYLRYKVTPSEATNKVHPFSGRFEPFQPHGVLDWPLFSQYCSFGKKKQSGELMATHPEDLHASIRKVTEYLLYTEHHLNDWMDNKQDEYWRIFQWRALIVLRSDLYTFSIAKRGAATLTPTTHARLEYSLHYDNSPTAVVLDFIVEKAVPQFIKTVASVDRELDLALHEFRVASAQRSDADS
jgi:hypothetical protein